MGENEEKTLSGRKEIQNQRRQRGARLKAVELAKRRIQRRIEKQHEDLEAAIERQGIISARPEAYERGRSHGFTGQPRGVPWQPLDAEAWCAYWHGYRETEGCDGHCEAAAWERGEQAAAVGGRRVCPADYAADAAARKAWLSGYDAWGPLLGRDMPIVETVCQTDLSIKPGEVG